LKSIADADDTAKKAYLNREPQGIDGSLKNNDTVKKILDKWGEWLKSWNKNLKKKKTNK